MVVSALPWAERVSTKASAPPSKVSRAFTWPATLTETVVERPPALTVMVPLPADWEAVKLPSLSMVPRPGVTVQV